MISSVVRSKIAKTLVTKVATTRSFFSKGKAMPLVSLEEEFPGTPLGDSSALSTAKTTSTQAASGLRITSDTTDNKVAVIGVAVKGGSQFETEQNAGINQLMEKMAFRCTQKRSDLRLYRDIEAIGGTVKAQSGRDVVSMSISVLPCHIEAATQILAESVLEPKFSPWDVDLQKQVAKAEAQTLLGNPEKKLVEGLHAAAFYDTTPVGRSVYSPYNLGRLKAVDLKKFHEQHFNTGGMSLIGVGVDHGILTDLANTYFGDVPKGDKLACPKSEYVGGEWRERAPIAQTYVSLGFNGISWADHAKIPVGFVLMELLSHRMVKFGSVFNMSYDNAGLLGFSGACVGQEAGKLVDMLVNNVKSASGSSFSENEVAIAKALTKQNYAIAYENRQHRFDVLGNVTNSGYVQSLSDIISQIDAVTGEQLEQCAQKILKSNPSIAAYGDLAKVPRYNELLKKFK